MAEQSDAQDLREAEARAEAAEILAASLRREMDELRARLHDDAVVRAELAAAQVAIAERDVEIATVRLELRDVFQGMSRPEDHKGHPRARAQRRRDDAEKRRRPQQRIMSEPVASEAPRTLLAVPALRWIGEIVEADK